MDLSPREVVPTAPGRKRKRPWLALGVLLVVLLAGGALVAKFLTSAIERNFISEVRRILSITAKAGLATQPAMSR